MSSANSTPSHHPVKLLCLWILVGPRISLGSLGIGETFGKQVQGALCKQISRSSVEGLTSSTGPPESEANGLCRVE
ncbi:hypothetical protein PTTG_28749, partial [Puccinia triticina 1-1 BBBD Race 1]